MRSTLRGLVLSGSLCCGLAASAATPTVTHTLVQHRAVFDLVGGGKTDLRAVCGGAAPMEVAYRRTAADFAAGIFSGWWYTPVHVRVTCAAPTAP